MCPTGTVPLSWGHMTPDSSVQSRHIPVGSDAAQHAPLKRGEVSVGPFPLAQWLSVLAYAGCSPGSMAGWAWWVHRAKWKAARGGSSGPSLPPGGPAGVRLCGPQVHARFIIT